MTLTLMFLDHFFLRRCGYSKAKQDPEEEKMHFHNGHSRLKPRLVLYVFMYVGLSSSKVYSTCTVQGSHSGHVWSCYLLWHVRTISTVDSVLLE